MGAGAIIRNENGRVVASLCATVPSITEANVAEAMALWKMVSLCKDLGIQRLHIEGDALEIVRALCLPDPCWSRFGTLIEATRFLLQNFQSWQVFHVCREPNEAAHYLAKAVLD